MKPETIFCSMLETSLDTVIRDIESALVVPAFALSSLRSNINRLFSVTYKTIYAGVKVLQDQIYEILKLDLVDSSDTRDDFCRIAFACEALMNLLTDTTNSILPLTDAQKEEIMTNYTTFENLVCRTGLGGLIDAWTDEGLDIIYDKLIAYRERLLGAIKIDELIDRYMQILENSGIYDFIDQLRKYASCGFAICNYVDTVSNKIADIETRLSIERVAGSYKFLVSDSIQKVYDLDEELDNQIGDLETIINTWRTSNTRTYTLGVSRDDASPTGK